MNTTHASYSLYKRLFTLVFMICFSLSTAAQGFRQQRDSLSTQIQTLEGKEKLMAYLKMNALFNRHMTSPDSLDTYMAFLDEYEAETIRQQNISHQAALKESRIVVCTNMSLPKEVINRAPEILTFLHEHEQWRHYYSVIRFYIEALCLLTRFDEALEIARESYAEAKKQDDKSCLIGSLQSLAIVYQNLGRMDETLDYYRQAIEIGKGDESVVTLTLRLYEYTGILLLDLKRYEEAEALLKEHTEALALRDKHSVGPSRIGRGNLLFNYTRLYIQTGHFAKAEDYCNQYEEIAIDKIGPALLRQELYEARGDYAKALEAVDRRLQFERKESLSYLNVQQIKARILAKLGRGEDAFALVTEVFARRDSIRDIDIDRQIDELRTQYEVDRHILEKERYILEKQRNRNYFLLALAGCVLLAVALTIWIAYSRRLRAKNRVLYEQIQARNQCRIAHEETLISRPQTELTTEMRLFRQLSLLMKEEHLYTDPAINRRALADRLATNERYLAEAIRAGAGETFNNYINQQRLTYALDLLITQPNLPIEAVASDAGFNSYPTFHRLFSRTYGMGASEYRRMAFSKA